MSLGTPSSVEEPLGRSHESAPKSKTPSTHNTHYLKSREFGVWQLLVELPKASPFWSNPISIFDVRSRTAKLKQDIPFLQRFVKECFAIAPWRFLLWATAKVFCSLMPAIILSCSGRLLELIQPIIEQKMGDHAPFYKAAVALVGARLFSNRLNYVAEKLDTAVSNRISKHFGGYLLRVHLRLDVPTFEDKVTSATLEQLSPGWSDNRMWEIIGSFTQVITVAIQMISQLSVLVSLLRSEDGGALLGLVTCLQPLLAFATPPWMPEVWYLHAVNPHFSRMKRMKKMAESAKYRPHIIGDGLEEYISSEYQATVDALGDVDIGSPWGEIDKERQMVSILHSIIEDLPMILFAARAFGSSGVVPLKSLTLLRTTAQSVQWTLHHLTRHVKQTTDHRKAIRALYESVDIKNTVVDGEIPYPRQVDSDAVRGMEIEFRNVTFKYPRDVKKEPVLSGLSFRIQPGQLCVIVGENGCGKSTTIKLLSRIFDVTEGEILIDGLPIQSYKVKDLRRAEAMLYQDFVRYPLTLRENIGLGSVEHSNDLERIRRAAQLAGAHEFIESLPLGLETPATAEESQIYSSLGDAQPDGPIKEHVKNLEVNLNLSGGQWQRLAVAKTFMRVEENDHVRLMCFDEPSSALDPKAEFDLFEKLRSMRGRRSLVFVTHRFGHLTKHADIILYMKKGVIIEKGTHAELLAQGGAYAHLYNVQAQAFSTEI